METKRWLAFANKKRCNHAQALRELGFINWTMNRVNFNIGDTVYLFLSDERRVRYKTIVVATDCYREDVLYWVKPAPNDSTYKLALADEYLGSELSEKELTNHGFKGGQSIEKPMCNNQQLIDYIDDIFSHQKYGHLIAEVVKTPITIENVKRAIPILIYWAKQGRTGIPYIEFVQQLNYDTARPINKILGAIHDVLSALSHLTKKVIPTLNALVVNQQTGIPSDGFSYVRSGYETLSNDEKKIIVNTINQDAMKYERWDWVLSALELHSYEPISSDNKTNEQHIQTSYWGHGGEGIEHKLMKEYISTHPEILNIHNIDNKRSPVLEYTLLSSDRIDILFEQENGNRIAIEIKPKDAPNEDILRGIYQCVKYQSLLDAEDTVHKRKGGNRCILVIGGKLSQDNKSTASILGINVVEEFSYVPKSEKGW